MENVTIRATELEIIREIVKNVRHSARMEWMLIQLGIHNSDPQRPHDVNGKGHKLETDVLMRLALEYRLPRTEELVPGTPDYVLFHEFVKPAFEYHRENQNHHRAWEGLDPEARDEDMRIGAVDTIVSMSFEERPYQRIYSLPEIEQELGNHPRKGKWIKEMLGRIHQISLDPLEVIANLEISSMKKLADFGLPMRVCDNITEKLNQAVYTLKKQHKYMIKEL